MSMALRAMGSAGRLQYTLSGKSGEAAKVQRNIQEVLLPQITHHKGFRHLNRIGTRQCPAKIARAIRRQGCPSLKQY